MPFLKLHGHKIEEVYYPGVQSAPSTSLLGGSGGMPPPQKILKKDHSEIELYVHTFYRELIVLHVQNLYCCIHILQKEKNYESMYCTASL